MLSVKTVVVSLLHLLFYAYASIALSEIKQDVLLFNDNFIAGEAIRWNKNAVAIASKGKATLALLINKTENDMTSGLLIEVAQPLGRSISWVSNEFILGDMEYLLVDASVESSQINREDKTWYGAGITLQFFDSKGRYLSQEDVVRLSGTHTTELFRKIILIPQGAVSARLLFGMVGATGKAILHNIMVLSKKYKPQAPIAPGAILPTPWMQDCADHWISADYFAVIFPANVSDQLKKSILSVLHKIVGEKRVLLHTPKDNKYVGQIRFELKTNVIMQDYLATGTDTEAVELTHKDGYQLFVVGRNSIPDITVKAGTESGLYYATQSLAQLITSSKVRAFEVMECRIRDWPVLSIRGLAGGRYGAEYINKLSQYKFNEVQISGAPGVWADWAEPVSSKKERLVNTIGQGFKNSFVDGTVAIWPGGYGEIFTWTDQDHNDVLAKKAKLYQTAGFSSILLICASDYERVGRGDGIISPVDKQKKLTLKEAHSLLTNYMTNSLNGHSKNIRIVLFPFYYLGAREYGEKETKYLASLSDLPSDISIIYGGRLSKEDIELFSELIGRKPLIRIPAPAANRNAKGVGEVNMHQLLEEHFSGISPELIEGVIIEAPEEAGDLEHIAEFLWNFGRKIH